jgi:hypothetical protein
VVAQCRWSGNLFSLEDSLGWFLFRIRFNVTMSNDCVIEDFIRSSSCGTMSLTGFTGVPSQGDFRRTIVCTMVDPS